jgi:hypothetical protein
MRGIFKKYTPLKKAAMLQLKNISPLKKAAMLQLRT